MMNLVFYEEFGAQRIVSTSSLCIKLPGVPKRVYRHGWQSWSLAAWTDPGANLPIPRPKLLYTSQHDPLHAFDSRPHGSWVGAVEFEDGRVLLVGSLGLDAHVMLNQNQLEGKYDSGEGEWLIANGDESVVFAHYANELGKRLGKLSREPAPRVWCSWYSLYTTIDEQILFKVFDDLGDLPFDVLQVDDGWQVSIGDWQANDKFPSGLAALAGKIKSTGRKAGLWLAPLIAVKSSNLFQEHQDWFLRDERGKFVSAGINWGQQLYGLDTTRPEVLQWLTALMKKVRAWGFDYLKLDFLYGGALPAKRYKDVPRETAYRNGLKVMRQAMGADAFFLACGAPILPSLGLCNAMRVGPDVAGEWENYRDAALLFNPTAPGTKNAIRTTLHRFWLRPLVHIDPDVAYFRSVECSLTAKQKTLLQNLALICNFKATSDLPQWLSKNEHKRLRAFLQKSPSIQRLAGYRFKVDEQHIDFSAAVPLPGPARGWAAIQGDAIGWLANHQWALKIFNDMNKNAWKKTRRDLK